VSLSVYVLCLSCRDCSADDHDGARCRKGVSFSNAQWMRNGCAMEKPACDSAGLLAGLGMALHADSKRLQELRVIHR
jgi:hypothetical protein